MAADPTYPLYEKQVWKDYPDTSSPINASRLGHIEQGIYDGSSNLRALELRVAAIEQLTAAEEESF